jgi:hypothetical protein
MRRGQVLGLALLLSACIGLHPASPAAVAKGHAVGVAAAALFHPGAQDALFVGAGDIARCSELAYAQRTGAMIEDLLRKFPDAQAFTLGDNAYEDGTAEQFRSCYQPAWGSFNARTAPSPGNHEYHKGSQAQAYFEYFDYYRAHPEARQGYYSFDLKGWHILSLNSDIPMDDGSPQVTWLEADLSRNPKKCVLAYWHHPRFSSGEHGQEPSDPGRRTGRLWEVLVRHGADVILNGHDHDYERFAPMDADGRPSSHGVREFVVGTGGAHLYPAIRFHPQSQVRDNRHHGVIVFTLHPDSYEWVFLGTDGKIHDRSDRPVSCGG